MATKNEIRNRILTQIRASEAEIEQFVISLEKILAKGTKQVIDGIKRGDKNALNSIFLIQDLDQVLDAAGLQKELNKLRGTYAAELNNIAEEFASLGVAREGIYSALDRQIVETLISNDFQRVGQTISLYGGDIKAQITRSVLLGESPAVEQIISDYSPRAISRVRTELNTGMQAFNRTVTAKKAVDLFGENPRFIYIGALDKVTRPFCEQVLTRRNPPIYSLTEIQAMDNQQINPVMAYGGGYNCRHHWRPVSERLEKQIREETENED